MTSSDAPMEGNQPGGDLDWINYRCFIGFTHSENVSHGGQIARAEEAIVPQLAPEHENSEMAVTG